jgi:uncharacterized protein (DUF1015 family)
MIEKFRNELGIDISSILIPAQGISPEKWAVVACDQYTSEPLYWEKVEDFTNGVPSTYHLIFPEVYLERENSVEKQNRIENINNAMCSYIDNNYFSEVKNSMIYVERKTSAGKVRKGLVFAVDLENYDFSKGSQSLIRATEGTIMDRLPPRIRIRENACLELPHIMLLIDDRDYGTIENLSKAKDKMKHLYSFSLMMNSGYLDGYQVNDEELLTNIFESLRKLKSKEDFSKKYGVGDQLSPLLFAVGDGNHSLATAKSCWNQLKMTLTDEEKQTHPAKFALIELVNVHDPALEFEPIHRLLFNIKASDVLSSFVKYYTDKGLKCGFEYTSGLNGIPENNSSMHVIPFIHNDKTGYVWVGEPSFTLDVATLQSFLDNYLKENNGVELDYVHGESIVSDLGGKDGNMGFLLSPMDKYDLFKTVIVDGTLPRKTFSMGEADEKRFYMECRNLR